MRYYLDTEFNGFGGDLISLALVSETGEELYLFCGCANPEPWVKENVLPIVSAGGTDPVWLPLVYWGEVIANFLHGDEAPTIVADWPDDIRYFCQCLITAPGEMVNHLFLRFEMQRVDSYPTTLPGAVQHNALWDARALRHRMGDGR